MNKKFKKSLDRYAMFIEILKMENSSSRTVLANFATHPHTKPSGTYDYLKNSKH